MKLESSQSKCLNTRRACSLARPLPKFIAESNPTEFFAKTEQSVCIMTYLLKMCKPDIWLSNLRSPDPIVPFPIHCCFSKSAIEVLNGTA